MKKYIKTIVLQKNEYEHLKNSIFAECDLLKYINYYYDTPDFSSIKSHNAFYIQHFGMSGTTVNRIYSKEDPCCITETRSLTDGGINERLVRKLMLTRVGELTFERYIISTDQARFILDKNTYLNIVDYEIIIETVDKHSFLNNEKISRFGEYLNLCFPSREISFSTTCTKEKSQRFFDAKMECNCH